MNEVKIYKKKKEKKKYKNKPTSVWSRKPDTNFKVVGFPLTTDTHWVSHLPKTSNSSVDRYCSAYNSSE